MKEFSIRSSTKSIRPNFAGVVISTTLIVFLAGCISLVYLQKRTIEDYFRNQLEMIVELKEDAEDTDILAFREEMEKKAYIQTGSVVLTTREEAASSFREELGDDWEQTGITNPFFDMVSFRIRKDHCDSAHVAQIKTELRSQSIVHDVYYEDSLFQAVVNNTSRLYWVITAFSGFVLLIVLTLLHFTFKLALFADRFLIKNMELLGATWWFIKKPYIQKGVRIGFVSGLLGILMLTLLLFWLLTEIPDFWPESNWVMYGFLVAGLLLATLFFTGLSTYIIVSRFLKQNIEELY